jgi:hypothetical protein
VTNGNIKEGITERIIKCRNLVVVVVVVVVVVIMN